MTPEQEFWLRIVEVAGTWLSAIGTLIAAGIALWLALRTHRLRLQLRASYAIRLLPRQADDDNGIVHLHAYNRSATDVTITAIGWKIGMPFNQVELWQRQFASDSDELPKRLAPNDSATFIIPFEKIGSVPSIDAADFLSARWPLLSAWYTKIVVGTTAGQGFETRIEPNLRYRLVAAKTGSVGPFSPRARLWKELTNWRSKDDAGPA